MTDFIPQGGEQQLQGQQQQPQGGQQQNFNQGVPAYQGNPQQQFQVNPVPNYQQQNPQFQGYQQAAPQVQPKEEAVPTFTGGDPLSVGVQSFTQRSGVSADALYGSVSAALQYGDPNLINLQEITAGLSPAAAAEARALASAIFQQAQQTRQQAQNAAYSAAGSKEAWEGAVAAFNSKAPPHVMAAAKALEETGNVQGAIQYVLETVRGLGLVPQTQGQPVQGSLVGSAVQGLSEAQFRAELGKIYKERGMNNAIHDPRYQQIIDARQLGRQQGI